MDSKAFEGFLKIFWFYDDRGIPEGFLLDSSGFLTHFWAFWVLRLFLEILEGFLNDFVKMLEDLQRFHGHFMNPIWDSLTSARISLRWFQWDLCVWDVRKMLKVSSAIFEGFFEISCDALAMSKGTSSILVKVIGHLDVRKRNWSGPKVLKDSLRYQPDISNSPSVSRWGILRWRDTEGRWRQEPNELPTKYYFLLVQLAAHSQLRLNLDLAPIVTWNASSVSFGAHSRSSFVMIYVVRSLYYAVNDLIHLDWRWRCYSSRFLLGFFALFHSRCGLFNFYVKTLIPSQRSPFFFFKTLEAESMKSIAPVEMKLTRRI